MSKTGDDDNVELCVVCCEPLESYGVLDCGHYLKDTCAVRLLMHSSMAKCPTCRQPVTVAVLTQKPPRSQGHYSVQEIAAHKKKATLNKRLKVYIGDAEISNHLNLLTGFFCPVSSCWETAEDGTQTQEPFLTMQDLHNHLLTEHKKKFCRICLENRPSFLSEIPVYTEKELDQHHRGKCQLDDNGFDGHPICLFCRHRHFDGEVLLKHMQAKHYSCDLCNTHEFTFIFYKDRAGLNAHFARDHHLCTHQDCCELDVMLRVYKTEFDLIAHRQRAHGEKSKLDLNSFGFQFSAAASSYPATMAVAHMDPNGGGLANAASSHADKIFFDFNGRIESVSTVGDQTDRRGRDRAPNNKSNEPKQINPADSGEANKKLKQELMDILNAQDFNAFKVSSANYLQGKIKSTEYFSVMISLIPDQKQLESISHLIITSIPDAEKREALTATKNMMLSEEATKRREIEKEERKKQELEELRLQNAKSKKQERQDLIKGAWKNKNQPAEMPRHHVASPTKKSGQKSWASLTGAASCPLPSLPSPSPPVRQVASTMPTMPELPSLPPATSFPPDDDDPFPALGETGVSFRNAVGNAPKKVPGAWIKKKSGR